jgi:hypothetical protein
VGSHARRMLGLGQTGRGAVRPQRFSLGQPGPPSVSRRRRKTLRRQTLHNEFLSLSAAHRLSSKTRSLYRRLRQLAAQGRKRFRKCRSMFRAFSPHAHDQFRCYRTPFDH